MSQGDREFEKKILNPFDKTRFQYFKPVAIWLTGFKDPSDFRSEAILMKAGEINPDNNFRCIADEYNLPIRDLVSYDDWKKNAFFQVHSGPIVDF